MRIFLTILFLTISNVFMTFAWYGHLKLKNFEFAKHWSWWVLVLLSWGIAFFEYIFQVPANRFGSIETGGSFDIFQLRVLQEVISLVVFTLVVLIFFKGETLKWNHMAAFACLILAVIFIFKK
jgi:uncharacterized protein